MFNWLTGHHAIHLYTGYVSARRRCDNGTMDVATAPYAVFSSEKAAAMVQGVTFIRERCPSEEGWIDHRAEFIKIPDFLIQKPRIRALSMVAEGISFDGSLEVDEVKPS